jgi:hypothetical protein
MLRKRESPKLAMKTTARSLLCRGEGLTNALQRTRPRWRFRLNLNGCGWGLAAEGWALDEIASAAIELIVRSGEAAEGIS